MNSKNNYKFKFNNKYSIKFLKNIVCDLDNIAKKEENIFYRQSNYRQVFETELKDSRQKYSVVIKRYKNVKIGDWVSSLFKRSKAEKEWKVLTALYNKNINVPEPILMAEKRWFGFLVENILIIKAVKNTKDLLDCVKQGDIKQKGFKFNKKVIKQLACFIKQIHNAGLFHKDLHASNILFDIKKNKFYLLDFHRACFKKKLKQAQILIDFAYLNASIGIYLNKQDMLYFINEYNLEYTTKTEKKEIIQQIQYLTAKFIEKPFDKKKIIPLYRQKLLLRESTKYKFWFKRKSYARKIAFRDFLSKLEVIKDTETRFASRLDKDVVLPFQLMIKGYKKWKTGRKKRFKQEWLNSFILRDIGVSSPEPVFFCYNKIKKSYYYGYRFVQGAKSSDEFFYSKRFSYKNKIKFIKQLALFVKEIHEKHVYHKDFKCANILVRLIKRDKYQFFLIDNDRIIFFKKNLRVSSVIFNLAQINASFPRKITDRDRMRFIMYYSGKNKKIKNNIYKYKKEITEITLDRWKNSKTEHDEI
jgi:tRNA A-37 threonylcarbamoyl transferase component Bud32